MNLPIPKEGERIITTMPFAGLRAMQVCAVADVTDEELLAFGNKDNPQMVTGGWHHVVRSVKDCKKLGVNENAVPGDCKECPGRKHFILVCM